jgi:hypothetical protein
LSCKLAGSLLISAPLAKEVKPFRARQNFYYAANSKLAYLARAHPILKMAGATGAVVVVPSLRLSETDAAEIGVTISQRLEAVWTE